MSSVGRGKDSLRPAWMKKGAALPEKKPGGLQASAATSEPVVKKQAVVQPRQAVRQAPAVRQQPVARQQRPQPIISRGGWTQHTAPDGRAYYYHAQSKESTFEKPQALKSDVERSLPSCDWKEYKKAGKTYFFNAVKNESVWEEPTELTVHRERYVVCVCAWCGFTLFIKGTLYSIYQGNMIVNLHSSLVEDPN